jgi:hypothetical protein
VTIRLRVYDPTNTSLLGTVAYPHHIGFSADLRVPGALVFQVDKDNSTDRGLLQPLRVVRVWDDVDGDLEAYVVQDQPAEVITPGMDPTVRYVCRHVRSWLGYDTGGATLWPYGGIGPGSLEQNPRWFGPMGFDFPALVGVPEPTSGGAPTRENWADANAERLVFAERAVYRRELPAGDPSEVGKPSRMWFTSASWTDVRVWLDGAEVPSLNTPVGDRSIRTLDLVYDGEPHVICFDGVGTPPVGFLNSLAWTWGIILTDANDEPNIWNVENRLFTTFNSVTYGGPTPPSLPYWQAWEDYADGDYPGVTVGFVADRAVDEAQARGALAGLTMGFTPTLDSDGLAWTQEFARSFPMQRLGRLFDALGPFGCEVDVTPAGVLEVWQNRGQDRTGTVTIDYPYRLGATGRGVQATRYLAQTEGGFIALTDTAAETAFGVVMEDVVSLGNDLHGHIVADPLAAQLADDAGIRNEVQVDLPDDVVPYRHVWLGDVVNCWSDADHTSAPMRVTAFAGGLADKSPHTEWKAVLEPA